MPTVPFTGDELIEIGRAVNRITKRLAWAEDPLYGNKENRDEPYVKDIAVTVQIPSYRDGEGVGEIRYYDGWFGFFPEEVTG